MGEVVKIEVARARKDEDVNRVFDEYRAAKMKADATMAPEDAIAAAKVWKRFLELFCGEF